MAIGCGATCAKIILIVYNIIFLCTGIILIALGIWLIADGSVKNIVTLSYNGSDSAFFRNAAILLIAMGALVLIISIVGFVGAILENVILLGIYISFLVIIFCGEIAGGVVAIVFKDQIIYNLTTILGNTLNKALTPNTTSTYYQLSKTENITTCVTSDVGYLWDFAQSTLQCCGLTSGYTGYEILNATNNFQTMCPGLQSAKYPLSCCPFNSNRFTWSTFHTNPDNQYTSNLQVNCSTPFSAGCEDEVSYWLSRWAPVLIGIGIGFGMFELYGLIFAVCLCRNVSDEDHCSCCDVSDDSCASCCEPDNCCKFDSCGDGCCSCFG